MTARGNLFMSYARADEPVAVRLYEALTAAGQDVWLDVARLRHGSDWWEGVRCAIDQCVGVLLIQSEESLRSISCSRELAYAVARGRPIVGIDIELRLSKGASNATESTR
jgi:TIR domain